MTYSSHFEITLLRYTPRSNKWNDL